MVYSSLFYIGKDAKRAALVNDLFPEDVFYEFLPTSEVAAAAQKQHVFGSNALCLVDLLDEPGQLTQLYDTILQCLPNATMVALHLYRHDAQVAQLRTIGFDNEVPFTGVGANISTLLPPNAVVES